MNSSDKVELTEPSGDIVIYLEYGLKQMQIIFSFTLVYFNPINKKKEPHIIPYKYLIQPLEQYKNKMNAPKMGILSSCFQECFVQKIRWCQCFLVVN